MYAKVLLLVFVAGFYLCSAAPAETEEPQNEIHSSEAIPDAPELQLPNNRKLNLGKLPSKIVNTIKNGKVTIGGSVSIGLNH